MTEPAAEPDPTRDLLVWRDYQRDRDGTERARPIPLAAAAAEWQRLVDSGRAAELRLDPEDPSDFAAFSTQRAKVVAVLLEELAIRLEPGREVGPIAADDSLSRLAASVAAHLRTGSGW